MEELEQELASQYDLHFDNEQLLQEALTQANYLNEHPEVEGNDYQRLEFWAMLSCNNQRQCIYLNVFQIGMKVD
ncbi:ribonuclease III [Weissella viridescens]|uniref:Ribonuclease III n=1 Tax=Weissella viridescens TaxID=1629 RepID=A0A380P8I4_WEIVI|nr:ribonuclease III [Weissella viridescens]